MNRGIFYRLGVCTLWCISIIALCYLPKQHQFDQIALYGSLAFLSYFLILCKPKLVPLRWLILMAVGVRIMIIPSLPLLSDDIYRFIWDGRLWHLGMNPYSHLPSHWVSEGVMGEELFLLLNSPDYYTIYPPLAQAIFYLSTLVSSPDFLAEAIVMKSLHCIFELGSLSVLWVLLKEYDLPLERWTLYALNPLIILEVLANVHHEGIMIFGVLLCLLYISKKHFYLAGVTMALAIATKLLPLLFCPLLFFYLKGANRWKFTISTLIITLLLFFPFLINSDVFSNLLESTDLYVRSFEFNASIYYICREFGQWIYGYNIIGTLGPILKLITVAIIFYIAFVGHSLKKKSDLFALLLYSYLAFVVLSSTVHPWYLLLLVGLSPLTSFRFPLLWSFLILSTYANYSFVPYQEQMWIVIIEYVIVSVVGIIEYQNCLQKEKGPLPIIGE